ncbi:hypothetical protein Tco_1057624 [Tanacetum coccineum]|uniref:Uncharacterized protein n=1 Tax=Tanacetum coccineum TaxID=301880 RepID=A0ABQ5H5Y7_9ASTR
MRKIMANDQADYYSGITSITVNGKNAYDLKGKFLDDLHKNAFSGTNGEDADSELKEEALRNKAIMEGLINEDDESCNNGWKRWDNYEIADHDQEEREYDNEHEEKERCELFAYHELLVCTDLAEKKEIDNVGEESTIWKF